MSIQTELQQMNQLLADFVRTQTKQFGDAKTAYKDLTVEMDNFRDRLGNTNKLSDAQQKIHKKALDEKKKEIEFEKQIRANRTLMEKRFTEYLSKISDPASSTRTLDELRESYQKHQDAMDWYTQELDKSKEGNLKRSEYLEQQLEKSKKNAFNRMVNTFNMQGRVAREVADAMGHVAKNTGPFGQAASSSLGLLTGSMRLLAGVVGGVITIVGAFAAVLGIAVAQAYQYLQVAKAVGENLGGVLEGIDYDKAMIEFTNMARSYHMDPKELAKINMEFRQLVQASGGLASTLQFTNQVTEQQLARYGGSYEKARQETLKTLDITSRLGLSQTTAWKSSKQLTKEFDNLSKYGITNLNSILEQLTDNDYQASLKRMQESERDAFLQNQLRMFEHTKALGMTTEQAMAAAKALNKLGAEKPLERYKKAMKIRVLAGAYGMGAEAEEFARGYTMGKINPEQAQQFMTSLTGVMDRQSQGSFGAQVTGSEMMGKLGIEDLFGPQSPFSTELLKPYYGRLEENTKAMINANGSTIESLTRYEAIAKSFVDSMQDGTGAMRVLTHVIENFSLTPDFLKQGQSWLSSIKSSISGALGADASADYFRKQSRELEISALNSKEYAKLMKDNKEGEELLNQQRAEFNNEFSSTNKLPLVGGLPNTPTVNNPTKTSEDRLKEQQNLASNQQSANNTSTLLEKTDQTSDILNDQVRQTAGTNELLKQLLDTNKQVVDLAQKQLVASTISSEQQLKFGNYLRNSGSSGLSAQYANIGQ